MQCHTFLDKTNKHEMRTEKLSYGNKLNKLKRLLIDADIEIQTYTHLLQQLPPNMTTLSPTKHNSTSMEMGYVFIFLGPNLKNKDNTD